MRVLDDYLYLDKPEQWQALVERVRTAGVCGVDTEYHGWRDGAPEPLDDDKSPVGRSRIHVWSIAVPTDKMDPRGFRRARGWCLPAAALEFPDLRALIEDAGVRKAVHNQSVDQHALANHGITLRGGINTLGLVRWVRPGLITEPGRFKLKALMVGLLGRTPTFSSFREAMYYERTIQVSTWKTVTSRHCVCGEPGCRKRNGHPKYEDSELVEVVREKTERGHYNLWEVVPGHERWELLVKYSADDALAAMELLDLLEYTAEDPVPWPYGGERPGYSQDEDDATTAMEAVGFRVDVEWCRETAARAEADEEAVLVKLFRWFVFNAPTHGPHRREDVDPIWSSPAQKVRLFDELGFPRSPIWGKGRVKRGDVKMDATAMGWIGKNHPPAKQLTELLLHLQRIRSGKKYLVKLRDSGGFVHPICGPAGDEDDRAGAVTGRKGVKGELEAQQLPKEGDKDLYEVRKAIVA